MQSGSLLTRLSEYYTGKMLFLGCMLLDEISFTIQFAKTAIAVCDFEREAERKKLLDSRYANNQDLLASDLRSAPLIAERLESFVKNLPIESQTKEFAEKHLPYVKDFLSILEEYSREKAEINTQKVIR